MLWTPRVGEAPHLPTYHSESPVPVRLGDEVCIELGEKKIIVKIKMKKKSTQNCNSGNNL